MAQPESKSAVTQYPTSRPPRASLVIANRPVMKSPPSGFIAQLTGQTAYRFINKLRFISNYNVFFQASWPNRGAVRKTTWKHGSHRRPLGANSPAR
jgi:hypothetical protein